MNKQFYKKFGKQFLDLSICLFGGSLLLPLILIIAILVLLKLGAPIFFRQQRPGLNGKPFMLLKFRTMTDEQDEDGNLLPDSERLTKFGVFLRSTSLDELPALINVLNGDMSLVGPRPLLMQYLNRYTPEQTRRHEVRPGITGWAQVNGRNSISWEEKFEKDIWYVNNLSFILDLKIIFLTVIHVFQRDGINEEGQATVQEFMGTINKLDSQLDTTI